MNRFTFSYPTKVYFGEGSAAQDFRTELRKKGKTVLPVSYTHLTLPTKLEV